MEQKTSSGPVQTAGNTSATKVPGPGAGRLPQRRNPISQDERGVTPRRRRPSPSIVMLSPPPNRRSCSAAPGSRPDHAGPGRQPRTASAPQRPGAEVPGARVWPREATLGTTATVLHGAAASGLRPRWGSSSSPPQSRPRPTGRRRRSGGRPCLPVLRQRPLPCFLTPVPG